MFNATQPFLRHCLYLGHRNELAGRGEGIPPGNRFTSRSTSDLTVAESVPLILSEFVSRHFRLSKFSVYQIPLLSRMLNLARSNQSLVLLALGYRQDSHRPDERFDAQRFRSVLDTRHSLCDIISCTRTPASSQPGSVHMTVPIFKRDF